MSTPSSSGHDPQGRFASAEATVLWRQSAAQRAQFLGPATTLMLDLANLQEGSHVLDVAAGTGEQSLLAAQRLGASGRLLAIDLAAPMLEEAAASARAAGITTVDTQVMDAQHLESGAGVIRCGHLAHRRDARAQPWSRVCGRMACAQARGEVCGGCFWRHRAQPLDDGAGCRSSVAWAACVYRSARSPGCSPSAIPAS